MKHNLNEKLAAPVDSCWNYGYEIDADLNDAHLRQPVSPAVNSVPDTVVFGVVLVGMLCFTATVVITLVDAGLLG